jgi:hypothetical protein
MFSHLQVYGGAISVMVGPHAWSFIGTGLFPMHHVATQSASSCGFFVSGTSITNSRAVSSSSGNVDAAHLSAHRRLYLTAIRALITANDCSARHGL